MDLLVRELSLEYEAQLQARLPAATHIASATSLGSQQLSPLLNRAPSRVEEDLGERLPQGSQPVSLSRMFEFHVLLCSCSMC
jgi:hypothetical protein